MTRRGTSFDRRLPTTAEEQIRWGMRLAAGSPPDNRSWGVVTKHASGGPGLMQSDPDAARAVRAELVRFVLDAPVKDAIEALEAFDFEYPRGWSFVVDEWAPFARGVTPDHEARWASTREAWETCKAAFTARPEQLERLRARVTEILAGWPADVVAWYVAQVDAVNEAGRA